jgi:hypothetical protein
MIPAHSLLMITHLKRQFDELVKRVATAWKPPVTDDSARSDGGNTTENQPVSDQKMKNLGHTAIDHTREESGS